MTDGIKLYVSTTGSDNNNGSEQHPFATPSKAVAEVRSIIEKGLTAPVTVYFHKGEYNADNLEFTPADSGTQEFPVKYCAYGDGEVIFNSGASLDNKKFKPVSDEIRERLSGDAKEHVLVCDLKECGISKDENGGLYIHGAYCGAPKSDDDSSGRDCELFWNDKRLVLARYPNEGFLEIKDMCPDDTDEATRLHKQNCPGGCTVTIDEDTSNRIKAWKTPETTWMHGYFYWDWSFGSTPVVKFDTDLQRVYMKHATAYGAKDGGTYYFSNVLEELDIPGEYYFDNDELMLYVYPIGNIDEANIMFSASRNPIINMKGASYITFDGITLKGAHNHAIDMNASDCQIRNCKILDVYGWAIMMNGCGNTVYGCEITHTGRGGISISGGDRKTLTPANNVAENNYIHDWAEVYLTYSSGIELVGCGNTATHNELARTTHMAIYYNGNDNIIEYNYIHEVVQQSHDAGAVYGGRDWAGYGNIIRYNIIENVGNDKYTPVGIYWDDAQSGQTAYGNIIKNAVGKSFLIGGGRDNTVENNMMIVSEYPMLFDDRAIEGIVKNGWYNGGRKGGMNWGIMNQMPIRSEVWAKRFPTLAKVNDNFDDIDDPDFAPNPSRAVIRNNVCVCYNDYGFFVAESVRKLGTIENNLVFSSEDECIVPGSKYELKPEVKKQLPEFKDIPVDEIGLYKK